MNLFVTIRTTDGSSHNFHMTPNSWADFRKVMHDPGEDTEWIAITTDNDPEVVFAYNHIVWVKAEQVDA